MKRILIIAADSTFANFYLEGLNALGYQTQSANTIDAGIVAAWELQPDLVLIDPIFPESVSDPVERIRSGGRMTTTPFLAMSHLPEDLNSSLGRAGVKIVVSRGGNAADQVMEAIRESLGGPDASQTVGLVHRGKWRAVVMQKASQSIASLRLAAHSLIKNGFAPAAAQTLFYEAHFLSQCTELACLDALFKMTSALEDLIVHVKEQPANLNPSILRTLTQSIDFMEMLFMPNNLDRITDPAVSQLFAVDDDQNLLSVIKEAMDATGLSTSCVTDPFIALEMARVGLFNLIFLDVGMPGMNGFDLCTQIRALPAYSHIPIVFVTGMATFTNQVQSKLRGGNDFIAKPFNVSELAVKALMWIFKEQLELV
jgi:DNA-binding response OmpR family regulator